MSLVLQNNIFKVSITDYDPDGNLTSDKNKNITSILYNHLNMPTKITVTGSNAGTLDYVYTADGIKLQKTKTVGGVPTTTDYAGNYVYENNQLQFFNTSEGYVEPDGSGGYNYVYSYTDHLGNVRLNYSDFDGNGTISQSEILKERNFYPFGLEHKGYNNVVNGSENPYKYNGKEHNQELGLDWYDFGARNYDPTLGRWFNPDPLSDFKPDQTPYRYGLNNPIAYTDPSGLYEIGTVKMPTPDLNPNQFKKVGNTRVHKKTGAIYKKSNTSHGNVGNKGDQWKAYPKGTTDFGKTSKTTGTRVTIDGDGNVIGN